MSGHERRHAAPVSVLDRLLAIDAPINATAASGAGTGGAGPGGTLGRLRVSLLRDLEALLNSRKPWRSMPAQLPFLRTSTLGYGLADFAGGSVNSLAERTRLCAEIAQAITRFEPRLTAVEVALVENPSELDAVVNFRINAVLMVDPMPEPIVFDTTMDTTTSDVHLRLYENG